MAVWSAAGRSASGKFWYDTGRRNRSTERVPTEVKRASVVAGNGPPWVIACVTSTPVGQPFDTNRPAKRSSVGSRVRAAAVVALTVMERDGQLALQSLGRVDQLADVAVPHDHRRRTEHLDLQRLRVGRPAIAVGLEQHGAGRVGSAAGRAARERTDVVASGELLDRTPERRGDR